MGCEAGPLMTVSSLDFRCWSAAVVKSIVSWTKLLACTNDHSICCAAGMRRRQIYVPSQVRV